MNRQTAASIAEQLGLAANRVQTRAVGGGDIAEATLIHAGGQTVFVKTLGLEQGALLAAEADGLAALAAAAVVRVPRVLGHGETDSLAWLALEALDLRARNSTADARLGRQLAELHRCTGESHGWASDNFIGRTPQPNAGASDWSGFFRDRRLGYQLELLVRCHPDAIPAAGLDRVLRQWQQTSAGHQPAPSLLHGDLWSGNAAAIAADEPVIFDPAVHYGDRECDLAMSVLFGGFSEAFYLAYETAWPSAEGWQERRPWYQLYHLLNHANLFGGGYVARIRRELAVLSSS